MTRSREPGEPISSGRTGPPPRYRDLFRKAMFTVLFFAGVMLINGLIAILVIAVLQSVGWWEVSPAAISEEGIWQPANRFRASGLDALAVA